MSVNAASTPPTLYNLFTQNGQQHVLYRATDNGIYQVFYDPKQGILGPELWDTDNHGNFGLGNPATMDTPNQQHVFHINSQGILVHIFYDISRRQRKREIWNSGAAKDSTPATMYSDSNHQQHVFYRGQDNGLYQIFFDPNAPDAGAVVGGTMEQWAKEIRGNPATLYASNQQHVFYRDNSGNIWHIYYDETTGQRNGPEQWVGEWHFANDPLAQGDPVTLDSHNGQQHVFYRDGKNNINQVFYDPSNGSVGKVENWASGAAGNPATLFTPYDPNNYAGGGQQHLFYRSLDGTIRQVFYDSASNSRSGPELWATGVASDPAVLYTPNGQQHLFYINAADSQIYQVFYDANSNTRNGPERWSS